MREEWIQSVLAEARRRGEERSVSICPFSGGKWSQDGRTVLNFAGNDYLDLANHPRVRDRARDAVEQYGAGATASRLLAGTLPIHDELERRLAHEKGYPAAVLFGAGYLANVGTIPAIVGRGDHIFADRLVHASMIDACRLSGARLVRFAHNDAGALEARLRAAPPRGRRLILTESVFSMDGDLAPLNDIAVLAEKYEALLMVDEAHATGVWGPCGAGRIRELGLEHQVQLSMGTLSKALGGYGGFVACSDALRALLIQSARSFIYSTAPPPAAVGAALGALDILAAEPDRGARLLERAAFFRQQLQAAGLSVLPKAAGQILPVWIGDNQKAVTASRKLREQGIWVAAIRPPTVPAGSARLRLSVTLAHTREDLMAAAEQIGRIVNEL